METENTITAESQIDDGGFLTGDSPVEAVDIAPPKKRRGRPPKDPAVAKEDVKSVGANGNKPGPKKRGPKFTAEAIDLLANQIVGIHMLGAQVSGFSEMAISAGEGKALAVSVCNLSEHYGLSIDGKTGATLQLIATLAMIYAPRLMAVRRRIAAQTRALAVPADTAEASPDDTTTH